MFHKPEDEISFLKRILALVPGTLFWKDIENRYLGCNNNLATILGLASPSDIAGKTNDELLESEMAIITNRIDKYVLETGRTYVVEEVGFDANGEEAIYLVTKVPIFDDKGEVAGLLGISLDITQRKKAEREVIQAKEKAEAANQLKSEFIRNMEHDIRTPFSGILGLTKHLAETEQDGERKDLLGSIASSAKELLDYCNSILDFSKVDAGTLPIICKRFDLFELISCVINMESPTAHLKALELTCEYSNDCPEFLIGDRYRLQRILINLIGNAIKFTEQGFVKLAIKAMPSKTSRHMIMQFIIKDSGIGMPQEKQDMIFERFARIEPANRGRYAGQGLGLKVVKQFMDELDGDIDVTSKVGEGTTFICTIPFKLPLINEIM